MIELKDYLDNGKILKFSTMPEKCDDRMSLPNPLNDDYKVVAFAELEVARKCFFKVVGVDIGDAYSTLKLTFHSTKNRKDIEIIECDDKKYEIIYPEHYNDPVVITIL